MNYGPSLVSFTVCMRIDMVDDGRASGVNSLGQVTSFVWLDFIIRHTHCSQKK